MADEKTPEQIQQELFEIASAPAPEPEPEPAPTPEPAPPEVPPPSPAPSPGEPEATIPSWRLREEAEARRAAEQRAQTLEGRLNEIATHLRQQGKQPDFFENPDQAVNERIAMALRPLVEEQRQSNMYLGRMVAEAVHGGDKVSAAEQAFLDARARQTLDPADYERVVGSPNRYDAVVQWHKRQSVLSSVGDDPEAWFEKQFEARMTDPHFQAKVLEKVRGNAASRPAETRLPPSLSRATAAAPNREEVEGDLSDASLFAYAMNSKKRSR